MSGSLIEEVYILRQQYRKLSINDLLALVLAKHKNCQLLTGDKALRTLANSFNIEVHGTIWLVTEMIQYQKITNEEARLAFDKMKACGARLPWKEVEKIFFRETIDV
jgi:predicted nucleic acid-binding protein